MSTIVDQYGRPIESRANLKDPPDWLRDSLTGYSRSTAGEPVNPKIAMTVMAFFACVRNISEDIAKMPKAVRRKVNGRSEELPDHPVSRLLRNPSSEIDRHSFWQTYTAHALTNTGGFAEISYDGTGAPVELYLFDPTHINVLRSNQTNEIIYQITGLPRSMALRRNKILHYHGLGYDGVTGYVLPQLAKQLLGAAIALQKYRGSFFGNGANPAGILTHPATLSAGAAQRLRDQFEEDYAGSENANGIMTLEEGMTWTQVSIDPERAQMVDLTAITVEDICRMYRMPPHKVQHLARSTFSNIEHQNIEYDKDTLDPWVDRLRSELEFKLLRPEEREQGLYIHINMNALMRADTATRVAYFKDMYYMGAMSADDILRLEDRNPVDGGDRYFVQQNLIPADRVDDALDMKTKPPAGPPSTAPQEPPQNDARAAVRSAFCLILENWIGSLLTAELDRAKRAKDPGDFYARRQANLAKWAREQLQAVAIGMGIPGDVTAIADEYAACHCEQSRSDLETGKLNDWQNGNRARTWAEVLMGRVEELLCSNCAA